MADQDPPAETPIQRALRLKKEAQGAKPKEIAPEFFKQSNWYRLGQSYADALAAVGQGEEAKKVRVQLTIGR